MTAPTWLGDEDDDLEPIRSPRPESRRGVWRWLTVWASRPDPDELEEAWWQAIR